MFLALNGRRLVASQADATLTVLAVASGQIDEATFARWLCEHSAPATCALPLSTAGQGTHAQHLGRLLQPRIENGEVRIFVGRFLQNAGGSELNAVVAAQGKGVGKVSAYSPASSTRDCVTSTIA